MPTDDGLRTSSERRITRRERAILEQLVDMLDDNDAYKLQQLLPLAMGDPGWWLRDELALLISRRRVTTPAPGITRNR